MAGAMASLKFVSSSCSLGGKLLVSRYKEVRGPIAESMDLADMPGELKVISLNDWWLGSCVILVLDISLMYRVQMPSIPSL